MRALARDPSEPRQTAQPLAEDRIAVDAAPSTEQLAGRRHPRRAPASVQNVVIRHAEVVVTSRRHLSLPAAGQQAHAVEVERLQPGVGRQGGGEGQRFRGRRRRAANGRDGHGGGDDLQEIPASDPTGLRAVRQFRRASVAGRHRP